MSQMPPWTGLHAVVDMHTASQPCTPAAVDEGGMWTYEQLRNASLHAAVWLRSHRLVGEPAPDWSTCPEAPRPLAIAIARGRLWYSLCIGAWRLGLPLIAVSSDLPDKAAERQRNARIADQLRPLAVVADGDPEAVLPGRPEDCVVLQVEEFVRVLHVDVPCSGPALVPTAGPVSAASVLAYVYTGGTTRHSKCVVVTHAMALWEMTHYATALHGSVSRGDRWLQFSSAYWGAAVFGQLDVGLAFGACTVFATVHAVEDIAEATARHGITVLGVVPSQLRGAWPGGPKTRPPNLRVLIAWADKMPVKLAQQWKEHVQIFELLIASEYWLTFYSNCATWQDPTDGTEKHILRALPGLDMQLLTEDGVAALDGQVGELHLTGATVSPGYVGPDRRVGTGAENENAFTEIEGSRFYRSRDRLRRLHGGGYVYMGRAGTLAKRGGAWIDLEAIEAAVASVPGVSSAAVLASDEVDTFLVLDPERPGKTPFLRLIDRARRALGGESRVHVRAALPLHPATAKVDRRKLQADLGDSRTRWANDQANLQRMQRCMLLSYCAWYVPIISAVAGPSFIFFPPMAALRIGMMKLLLVPYIWAALLYSILNPLQDRSYYRKSYGPPDILLLIAASVPADLVGVVAALACGIVGWNRDRNAYAALAFVALSMAMLMAVAHGMMSISISALACVWAAACLGPTTIGYLAALPVSCFIVLPKWVGDDWIWRTACDGARLRRLLMRLLVWYPRPVWDASCAWSSWKWDPSIAAVEWGDETAWSNIRMTTLNEGMAVSVDYWEEERETGAQNPTQNSCHPNGSVTTTAGSGDSSNPEVALLSRLVERAGGCPEAVEAMDSLQAITLAELIRTELGRQISVKDVLRCPDVAELLARIAVATVVPSNAGSGGPTGTVRETNTSNPADPGHADADGAYRVFALQFPRAPVDWCVRYDGAEHLDTAALQRASDRLVARHSALRTVQTPDEPMREALDKAAAMWQLWTTCCGSQEAYWHLIARVVGNALFACWPRTFLRSAEAARVELKAPRCRQVRHDHWGHIADDEYVFGVIRELVTPHRWPYEIAVVPLYEIPSEISAASVGTTGEADQKICNDKGSLGADAGGVSPGVSSDLPAQEDSIAVARSLPRDAVSWYIHCSITHAYIDGASGRALFGDLLRYYAEEVGKAPRMVEPEAPEHLSLLQKRLKMSLHGRLPGASDPNNDVYHEIVCEDWGKRPGFSRRIFFKPKVLRALRTSATDVLGCSIDVAWLTATLGAMFRLFPTTPCIRLILKVGCRDGHGEREMVGFLSEQRLFPVDVGKMEAATVLDIANAVTSARRARDWRAPVPFEAGLCVYVNLVSAMVDGLPSGFKHVVKPSAVPARWNTDAYCHLNLRLDQLSADEWDFRIFHWDAAWGWEWSTYFAMALGSVIGDMVTAPTKPLLQATLHPSPPVSSTPDPPKDGVPSLTAPVAKRKAMEPNGIPNGTSQADSSGNDALNEDASPMKVPRTES